MFPTTQQAILDILAAPAGVSAIRALSVGADGALTLGHAPEDVRFRFAYHELPMEGHIRRGGGGLAVDVSALIGVLPYSLEHAERRRQLAALIVALVGLDIGVRIGRHQAILIDETAPLTEPITPQALITALTRAILDMKPVLGVLGEHLPELAEVISPRAAA